MSRLWPDLQRAYDEYNQLYFGGKLSHDILVKWVRLPRRLMGQADLEGIDINLNLRGTSCLWRFTLLHEMSHIATYTEIEEHGPMWQAEMHRLANIGAFEKVW